MTKIIFPPSAYKGRGHYLLGNIEPAMAATDLMRFDGHRHYRGNNAGCVPGKMMVRNLVCGLCNKNFVSKNPNAKYCSVSCRNEAHPNFKTREKVQRACLRCNQTFYSSHPNKLTCSKECSAGYQQERMLRQRAEASRLATEKRVEGLSEYTKYLFCNEADFAAWFNKSYWLYGFKRLVNQGVRFPDVLALDQQNRVIRVELEHDALNFKQHKHPLTCDLIISMTSSTDKVSGIPVIALFKRESGELYPTEFLKSITEIGNRIISQIESTYYEQINCTVPVHKICA